MATITTERNGRKTIRFLAPNGKRPKIRLGEIQLEEAKKIANHVDELVKCCRLAAAGKFTPPCKATGLWMNDLLTDPSNHWLYDRIASAFPTLIHPRQKPERPRPKPKKADKNQPMPEKLGAFLDAYISSRTDVKPGTATNYSQVRGNLVEFFGQDKLLREVTAGDADDFKRWLRGEKALADNTARRRCARAREFFLVAVRKRLIPENPFGHLKHLNVKSNKARQFFVTREVTCKILDVMVDGEGKPLVQWQLIFALNRFGALRCPSEVSLLTWEDVDWDHNRVTVHSPKTEQYEGKESRVMPLFPELRPFLEAAFNEAEARLGRPPSGSDCVIEARYRGEGKNLGTQLKRFIKRAGITPWPKLMNNLRSSRCTELERVFPEYMVTAWCGHSEKVAKEHYWQTTEEDYQQAALEPTGPLPDSKNGGAKWGRFCPKNDPKPETGEKGEKVQVAQKVLEQQRLGAEKTGAFERPPMTPTGLEPVLPP